MFLERYQAPRTNQHVFNSFVTLLNVISNKCVRAEGTQIVLANLWAPFLLKGSEDMMNEVIIDSLFSGYEILQYKTTIILLFIQFADKLSIY